MPLDLPWVRWARSLSPSQWRVWRERADAILAADLPRGETRPVGEILERMERSLEAAWREMTAAAPAARPAAVYAVLDLETGGLDPAACAICSVAVMTLDTNLNEVRRYHRLVADEPGRRYDPDALAINGLDPCRLRATGIPIAQVLRELARGLKGKVLVCHNARFDAGFLAARGIEVPEWICTLELARKLVPGGSLKLGDLARRLGVEQGLAHDALGDVVTCANVFRELNRLRESRPCPRPIAVPAAAPTTPGR